MNLNLLENEKILKDYDKIILTSHRIQSLFGSKSNFNLTSIMLEHITSCEYKRKTSPILGILGIISLLSGFYFFFNSSNISELGVILFVIGILLIIAYYFTATSNSLVISSPTAKIGIRLEKQEDVIDFINTLESAKNKRFLQRLNTTKQSSENFDETRYQPKF
ncbi:MAG: hypothetical protein EOM29_08910 [Bacteroidia bacterium]|nr:hypothetical protein [Bacteroidia bacterium]